MRSVRNWNGKIEFTIFDEEYVDNLDDLTTDGVEGIRFPLLPNLVEVEAYHQIFPLEVILMLVNPNHDRRAAYLPPGGAADTPRRVLLEKGEVKKGTQRNVKVK